MKELDKHDTVSASEVMNKYRSTISELEKKRKYWSDNYRNDTNISNREKSIMAEDIAKKYCSIIPYVPYSLMISFIDIITNLYKESFDFSHDTERKNALFHNIQNAIFLVKEHYISRNNISNTAVSVLQITCDTLEARDYFYRIYCNQDDLNAKFFRDFNRLHNLSDLLNPSQRTIYNNLKKPKLENIIDNAIRQKNISSAEDICTEFINAAPDKIRSLGQSPLCSTEDKITALTKLGSYFQAEILENIQKKVKQNRHYIENALSYYEKAIKVAENLYIDNKNEILQSIYRPFIDLLNALSKHTKYSITELEAKKLFHSIVSCSLDRKMHNGLNFLEQFKQNSFLLQELDIDQQIKLQEIKRQLNKMKNLDIMKRNKMKISKNNKVISSVIESDVQISKKGHDQDLDSFETIQKKQKLVKNYKEENSDIKNKPSPSSQESSKSIKLKQKNSIFVLAKKIESAIDKNSVKIMKFIQDSSKTFEKSNADQDIEDINAYSILLESSSKISTLLSTMHQKLYVADSNQNWQMNDHENVSAEVKTSMANTYFSNNDYEKAFNLYQEVLQQKQHLSIHINDYVAILLGIADCTYQLKLDSIKDIADHPNDVADDANNVANFYLQSYYIMNIEKSRGVIFSEHYNKRIAIGLMLCYPKMTLQPGTEKEVLDSHYRIGLGLISSYDDYAEITYMYEKICHENLAVYSKDPITLACIIGFLHVILIRYPSQSQVSLNIIREKNICISYLEEELSQNIEYYNSEEFRQYKQALYNIGVIFSFGMNNDGQIPGEEFHTREMQNAERQEMQSSYLDPSNSNHFNQNNFNQAANLYDETKNPNKINPIKIEYIEHNNTNEHKKDCRIDQSSEVSRGSLRLLNKRSQLELKKNLGKELNKG